MKWGCKCKVKHEAKEERKPKPAMVRSIFIPSHPRIDKIQTEFPRLFKWDQDMRWKVKIGTISKEEYLKERDANFADVLDDEADAHKKKGKSMLTGGDKQVKSVPVSQRPGTIQQANRMDGIVT